MKYIKFKQVIVLAGILAMAGAHADDKFSINGFGYQDYRQSNANSLDGADQRGTWDNNFFGIVMSVKIDDRNMAWAQLETAANEPTRFTWAFVDHRFNDNLFLHIGRVKFPYGLYTEFIDNKWLQISAVPPSIYNGASDMAYDAYNGVGLDWTVGSLFTQVYGGGIYNPSFGGAAPPYIPPTDADIPPANDRRMIGGRITWNTPHEGLRFMVSAHQEQIESTVTQPAMGQMARESHSQFSADYVSDTWDIKAEYGYHKIPALDVFSGVSSKAWYVQAGYKMGSWMPYARYDVFDADRRYTYDPSYYQKDGVIGVNYKINENMNARIEDHVIHGYGLAAAAGETAQNAGRASWNMMAAEVNFLF